MTLQTEIESRRGKAYPEILSEIQAITRDVIMPIEGQDLRDVVTVLASGLDYRLQMAEPSPLRSGLMRAFNSMSINEFGFNLSDPVVAQMLVLGVSAGLIDVNERLWFYAIATKQVPTYPDVQLIDVVKYFEPELFNDDWIELDIQAICHKLQICLWESLKSTAYMKFQAQELMDETTSNWSDWYDVGSTSIGIKRQYTLALAQVTGKKLRFRYKCPYVLNVSVTAV
jgi:hypothetical protein